MNIISKRILSVVLAIMVVMTSCFAVPTVNAKAASVDKTATVTAKKAKYSVTLNHKTYTIKKGKTATLKATLNKAAKKKTVVWSTSNKKIVTVNSKGKIKGIKKGSATITAKIKGTKIKATCKVTVGVPVTKVTANTSKVTLYKGKTYKLKTKVLPTKASNKKVTYTTSNKKVARVSSNGTIKAIAPGKATIRITANDGSNKKASVKVTVLQPATGIALDCAADSLLIGTTKQLTATVTPANAADKTVTWASSNPAIATVSATGLITAVAPGAVTIAATTSAGAVATCEITVYDYPPANAIALNTTTASIILGSTQQLTATVAPENAKDKTVTWASSNPAVATVSATGLVTGVATGTATITATTVTGITATCAVTVTATATNSTELNSLLANPAAIDIIYDSTATETVEISEGNYSEKTLTINAPNATFKNHAKFKSVTVNAIAQNTYIEYTENTINYNASSGHVVVENTGVATINLATASSSVSVENNGTVSSINVTSQVNLKISGSNQVPVNLSESATNTNIDTSVTLEIVSSTTWTMAILPGGEDTTASVNNENCLPTVYGIGIISVKVVSLNDIININAIMRDDLNITDKVTVKGSVYKNYISDGELERNVASGAQIYLIGYNADNRDMTSDNCTNYITNATSTTVDDNGRYTFENVLYGNYWVVTYLDGYVSNVQNLEIVSDSGNTQGVLNNGQTELISNEISQLENADKISGKVKDGSRGVGVPEGITVKLRAGNSNITGPVIATTSTDSNGKYEFANVPAGIYTLEALDLRQNLAENAITFNSANSTIIVAPGYMRLDNYSFTMPRHYVNSTVSGTGQVQFTLEWAAEADGVESDLDSHLFGPSAISGNEDFHVCYWDRVYTYNPTTNEEALTDNIYDYSDDYYYGQIRPIIGWGNQDEGYERYANLDVDDTSYQGPEHTTIYTQTPGIYRFYVHNFSNDYGDTGIYSSQAQVTVSIGNSQQTYHCPDGEGNVWYVGYYDSATRTFHAVNEMKDSYYEANAVGSSNSNSSVSPELVNNDIKSILDSAAKEKK